MPLPGGAPRSGDRGRSRGEQWSWRGDALREGADSLSAFGSHSPEQKEGSRRMHSVNRAPSELWMRWRGPDSPAESQVKLAAPGPAGIGAKATVAARRGSTNRYDLRNPQDGRIAWWNVSKGTRAKESAASG